MSGTVMIAEVLLRLVIATAAGALIGIYFELTDRPGGLSTHVLTAVGATLFCLSALRASEGSKDAVHAIQGIASGVGFIGAAAVLRQGTSVRGITTAASIWITAAVGCIAGLGAKGPAIVCAVFVAALIHVVYRAADALKRFRHRERSETPDAQ